VHRRFVGHATRGAHALALQRNTDGRQESRADGRCEMKGGGGRGRSVWSGLLQRETKGKGSRGIIIANEYSVLAGSAIGGGGLSVDVVTPTAGPVTIIAITRGNRRNPRLAVASLACRSIFGYYPEHDKAGRVNRGNLVTANETATTDLPSFNLPQLCPSFRLAVYPIFFPPFADSLRFRFPSRPASRPVFLRWRFALRFDFR